MLSDRTHSVHIRLRMSILSSKVQLRKPLPVYHQIRWAHLHHRISPLVMQTFFVSQTVSSARHQLTTCRQLSEMLESLLLNTDRTLFWLFIKLIQCDLFSNLSVKWPFPHCGGKGVMCLLCAVMSCSQFANLFSKNCFRFRTLFFSTIVWMSNI